MLYSNRRQISISGWLQENYYDEFNSHLKLQKFLFFYEVLCKIEDDEANFSKLRGYINGPVFSDIYGDYLYEKSEFMRAANMEYKANSDIIDYEKALFSAFLVSIMSEEELSAFTHEFNIWNSKQDRILQGQKQVSLEENDLNDKDCELLTSLKRIYTTEYIQSVTVKKVADTRFIIKNTDYEKLTSEQLKTLNMLANMEPLENPVYITLSEEGVVLVD